MKSNLQIYRFTDPRTQWTKDQRKMASRGKEKATTTKKERKMFTTINKYFNVCIICVYYCYFFGVNRVVSVMAHLYSVRGIKQKAEERWLGSGRYPLRLRSRAFSLLVVKDEPVFAVVAFLLGNSEYEISWLVTHTQSVRMFAPNSYFSALKSFRTSSASHHGNPTTI